MRDTFGRCVWGRRCTLTISAAALAVALVLLTGAGLLIHSFSRAINVDPGLDPNGVVIGRISLPRPHRSSDEAASSIRQRLLQGMGEIPGITSVALSFATPFQGGVRISPVTFEEDTLPPGSPQPSAFRVTVTPGYLEKMGLTLLEGRFYEEADQNPSRHHFVVDQSFARKFFPIDRRLAGTLPLRAAARKNPRFGQPASASCATCPTTAWKKKAEIHLSIR